MGLKKFFAAIAEAEVSDLGVRVLDGTMVLAAEEEGFERLRRSCHSLW